MSKLTDVLERFNRKERNLLIRDMLGYSPEKGLPLSESFRTRVKEALGDIEVPGDAWWATDYHLNWIAGAVAVWRDGEQANSKAYANKEAPGEKRRFLVEQNQEDADVLIAFDQTLILIEVKAFGYFTNQQIDSKAKRWGLLKRFCEDYQGDKKLSLNFVLMSLHQAPKDLNLPVETLLPVRLTDKRSWPHIVLDVPSASEKLKVTGRKPGAKASTPDPAEWFVVRVSPAEDDESTTQDSGEPTGQGSPPA